MEVSSTFAGSSARDEHVEITWRQAMNFAAATGDNNPWYLDDTREGGIVASPMIASALTWPIAERTDALWDRQDFPYEVLQRQVHFTEMLVWHRLMRPGDRLTIRSKVAAIAPCRGGTLLTVRFEGIDEAGQPVFTECSGAFLRGIRCVDGPRGTETLPALPARTGDGQVLWMCPIAIDPLAAHVYDGCANIHFPIHISQQSARAVGLPRSILQGTATLAFAAREILNREFGGDPARLRMLACRFTGMVVPGTEIVVRLLERQAIENGQRVFFEVQDAAGRNAISDGVAESRE